MGFGFNDIPLDALQSMVDASDAFSCIFGVTDDKIELLVCNQRQSEMLIRNGALKTPFDSSRPLNARYLGPFYTYIEAGVRKKRAAVTTINFGDGYKHRTWTLSISPLLNNGGDVRYLITHASQILSDRIENPPLKMQSNDTNIAADITNSGYFEVDFTTMMVWVSRPWMIHTGHEQLPNPFPYEHYQKIVDQETFNAPENNLQEHLEGRAENYSAQYKINKGNGDQVWVQSRGQVVERDESGTPLRFIGFMTDITEERKTRRELEKQKSMFQWIFEGVPDALILYNLKDEIVLCNDATEAILGFSTEELIGKSATSILKLNRLGQPKEQMNIGLEAENSFVAKLERKNGSSVPVKISLSEIETDISDNAYKLAMIRDESEIVSAHQALRSAKEAAEYANRAKSEFLAMMSHEIRTPMNGIIGMMGLLSKSKLTKSQRSNIGVVTASSNTLLNLINEILDYSKFEAGEMTLETVEFDLSEILFEVDQLMREKAVEKNISFEINSEMPSFVSIVGDPTRFRQVFYNLIGNAIKFTRQGQVVVSVSFEHSNHNSGNLEIRVSDTGLGISQEAQENLFNPFFQADTSITREYGGTGLGLSIVRQIATLFGGELNVESVEGKGSTFTFATPIEIIVNAKADEVTKKIDQKQVGTMMNDKGSHPYPLRILIAEDNKVNQMVVTGILDRFEHEITVVEDGKQAVVAVRDAQIEGAGEGAPFDLILMDVQMPVIDGESATRLIRALDGPASSIPIIALTAHAMAGDRERYLDSGMNDYVSKPIDPDSLFTAIDRCCGQDLEQKAVS